MHAREWLWKIGHAGRIGKRSREFWKFCAQYLRLITLLACVRRRQCSWKSKEHHFGEKLTINTIRHAILILISIYDVIHCLVSSWLCHAQIECFSRVAELSTWHVLLHCFQTGDVKQPHLIITHTYRPSHVICKHVFCHQLAVTTPSHWAWFIRVLCNQMLRFGTGFVSVWLFSFNRVLYRRSIRTISKSITFKDRNCTTVQWWIQFRLD